MLLLLMPGKGIESGRGSGGIAERGTGGASVGAGVEVDTVVDVGNMEADTGENGGTREGGIAERGTTGASVETGAGRMDTDAAEEAGGRGGGEEG